MSTDLPDLPRVDLGRMALTRRKILDTGCDGLWFARLEGEVFTTLHRQIIEALKLGPAARDALYDSLLSVLGSDLTPETATLLAWRLAGNLADLRSGRPVSP